MTVITLASGTAFLMWLGEQISERGIGNGISMIIFAGIVANFPSAAITTIQFVREGEMGILTLLALAAFMVGVVGVIIFSSAASAASRCNTPNGSWAGACTAARARTCR